MKVTEIVESISVNVNLGERQSTNFFVSMKAELEPGEAEGRAAKTLREKCALSLLNTVQAHWRARGKKLSADTLIQRYGIPVNNEIGF